MQHGFHDKGVSIYIYIYIYIYILLCINLKISKPTEVRQTTKAIQRCNANRIGTISNSFISRLVREDENSKKVLGAATASRANKSRPVS